VLSIYLFSCKEGAPLEEIPIPELTVRETYEQSLLMDSTITIDQKLKWFESGRSALQDSSFITLPFQEQSPALQDGGAYAHRFEAKRGERLFIELESDEQVLLDLWIIDGTEAYMIYPASDSLSYNLDENGIYIIRCQPAISAISPFTLRLLKEPQNLMPVVGADNEDAWSRFGDPRDAGKRIHEGVDIFKKRGTPIISASDGRVTNVSDHGLGGKQVWVRDARLPVSHYYAHLDSQYVEEGAWVAAGDTLGTVGNTGNARSTRPHLHYGMYMSDKGAIDPFPFIGQPGRIRRFRTLQDSFPETWAGPLEHPIRLSPSGRSPILEPAPIQASAIGIIGWTNQWWHVRLEDGRTGFVWGE